MLTYWFDFGFNRPSLQFTEAAAVAYYGSFEAYAEEFVYSLEHRTALAGIDTGRYVEGNIFRASNPPNAAELLALWTTLPAALVRRLQAALLALARDGAYGLSPREYAVRALGHQQRHPAWRSHLRAELATLQRGELAYAVEAALAED